MNKVEKKEYQKKYSQMQRQRFAPEMKKYRLIQNQRPETKRVLRVGEYRRRYNCTIEDYNSLFELQGGKCAICGRTDNYCYEHFGIDHDHFTGKIRGLLCVACNRIVGRTECGHKLSKKTAEKVEKYLFNCKAK